MTKRIVSGIFILTALGALGVILAGALTSGEQLIVRFLTAVIVAALGLYVISDLRLQSDEQADGHTRPGRVAKADAPPNSTAAFMASVTSPKTANEDATDQESSTDDKRQTVDAGAYALAGSGGPPPKDRISTLGLDDEKMAPDSDDISIKDEQVSVDPDSRILAGDAYIDISKAATPVEAPDKDSQTAKHAIVEATEDPEAATESDSIVDDIDRSDRSVLKIESSDKQGSETDADTAPIDSSVSSNPIETEPSTEAANGYSGLEAAAMAGSEDRASIGEHDWPGAAAHETTEVLPLTSLTPEVVAPDDESTPTDKRAVTSTMGQTIGATDYADAPLASIIDLREVHSFQTADNVDTAIKAGELEVIATLIEQGMLTTDGPISDRDVRTMVYVAFTSNELRKLLLAGGTPDGPNQGLDLGPVELFDENVYAPAPKTIYSGRPKAAEIESPAQRQLG